MDQFSPHEVSEKELSRGYWYLTHKETIKRIIVIVFIVINVALWGFVGWGLIRYFILDRASYQVLLESLPNDLVDYATYRSRNTPQDIQYIGINVLSTGEQQYDVVAKIRNPNDRWMQTFTYYFIYGTQQTKAQKGFVLPGETKYIHELALQSDLAITQPRIVMENQKWVRILNYPALAAERLAFDIPIAAIKHTPARSAALSGSIAVSQTSFEVVNRSPFNYWNVGFLIMLYKGTSLAAVNYISADQLLAGEHRDIIVNWFQDLPAVNKIDIIPEVNILDDSVFMPIQGEIRQESR